MAAAVSALVYCARVMNEVQARLGRRIRTLRESARMSQYDLADAADVDRVFLGQVERAQKAPGLEFIVKLSMALGVDPSDLFDKRGRKAAQNPPAHAALLQRLAVLTRSAPANEIARFELLAEAFFAALRPPRRKRNGK